MVVFLRFYRKPLLFRDPLQVISTHDPARIPSCFAEMEKAVAAGYYLAGCVSYEAGYAFEPRLAQDRRYDFPLVCMGVYKGPSPVAGGFPGAAGECALKGLRLNTSRGKYWDDIAAIRAHIAAGDVYQITYCIKLLFEFQGDPASLYRRLLREQPVPYPAYIRAGSFDALSLSPEKFFQKAGRRIITKPMKGTWPRGTTFSRDVSARLRFGQDRKNRAENLMIADLLRNDLGRIGGHVRAPRLFEVAGYKKLFQMTSTVTAEVAEDIPLYDLFAGLFPSGSVTGAPKIRAMGIIRELEQEDRRIYTGAIGYVTPRKEMFFNIPIRTLLIRDGHGEMGIGGGIVWDSTPEGEWQEGLLKARFVTDLYGEEFLP